MTIDYCIGIVVGVVSVSLAYLLSRLTRRDSLCDKCTHLCKKTWFGTYDCKENDYYYRFPPRYCSKYEEREDEHGST